MFLLIISVVFTSCMQHHFAYCPSQLCFQKHESNDFDPVYMGVSLTHVMKKEGEEQWRKM